MSVRPAPLPTFLTVFVPLAACGEIPAVQMELAGR